MAGGRRAIRTGPSPDSPPRPRSNDELVDLGRWDDEHLAVSLLAHPSRSAAEDQAAEATSAVGAEDDDVGRLGGRRVEDRGRRVALPDEERRPGARRASASDDRLRRGLHPGPFLVDPPEERPARQADPSRIDDAHDEELRPPLGGEADRRVDGLLGCGERSVARRIRRGPGIVGSSTRVGSVGGDVGSATDSPYMRSSIATGGRPGE